MALTWKKLKYDEVSATSRILGRKTAGAGAIEELTLSEVMDFIGSAAEGDILYRGASAWARLGKGSDGQVLTLASGLPSWAAAGGGEKTNVRLASQFNTTSVSFVNVTNFNVTLTANKNYLVVFNLNVFATGDGVSVTANGEMQTTSSQAITFRPFAIKKSGAGAYSSVASSPYYSIGAGATLATLSNQTGSIISSAFTNVSCVALISVGGSNTILQLQIREADGGGYNATADTNNFILAIEV